MAARSPFLPRLSLPRGDAPLLPLYNTTNPSIRKKPSEYDLTELSPRFDDGHTAPEPMNSLKPARFGRRSPSPPARFSDEASNAGSASKSRPNTRVLFAGPPPPIATSRLLYRDEEDRDLPTVSRGIDTSSFARNISSVLFERGPPPSHSRDRDYDIPSQPDAVWLDLQRRERALQQDLQRLLDAQSLGLAAHLDGGEAPSTSTATSSGDARSETSDAPPAGRSSSTPTSTSTPELVIPVRQPRPPKPLGLRAARAGLARTISLLADLKAEEDAALESALAARRQALDRLRGLTARREGIAARLCALEADDGDEPLARELRELVSERDAVSGDIAELEGRLAELRNKRRVLDERVEEVRNAREAGLSGYRGAMKEVEGRIGGLLRRPGVRPLDGDLFGIGGGGGEGEEGQSPAPGGVEFLRLRPERRTAEMAREWWEAEVDILQRRKGEVDRERAALEEGVEVWKEAVKFVSEFEAGLRRELSGSSEANSSPKLKNDKGKGKAGDSTSPSPSISPEQVMRTQLDKMAAVIASLEERLRLAEEKGWNLLICAIGAELEAFRQAEGMLRDALRATGFDAADDVDSEDDRGDSTPHLGRSASMRDSGPLLNGSAAGVSTGTMSGESGRGNLVDLGGEKEDKAAESDNEVPADLLMAAAEEHGLASPALSRDDSENEVPIEFLTEHRPDEGYPDTGFG
ncbi:hypothetical protein N656DRAFT_719453 [Canariomyces notabilis]|uniref:Autophagy-related protein 28 n=1 Tax=Canariomyces notabilis TaxID=2074819 RepID=A0AAN6T7K8_9PEZI|nr:hypothetical protein N656DRAFT_719453 [Canariomyces arenarius]